MELKLNDTELYDFLSALSTKDLQLVKDRLGRHLYHPNRFLGHAREQRVWYSHADGCHVYRAPYLDQGLRVCVVPLWTQVDRPYCQALWYTGGDFDPKNPSCIPAVLLANDLANGVGFTTLTRFRDGEGRTAIAANFQKVPDFEVGDLDYGALDNCDRLWPFRLAPVL